MVAVTKIAHSLLPVRAEVPTLVPTLQRGATDNPLQSQGIPVRGSRMSAPGAWVVWSRAGPDSMYIIRWPVDGLRLPWEAEGCRGGNRSVMISYTG